MERLELKYQDTQRALKTLKDVKKEPFSLIVRDAAIQRFKYTFEAFWKFIKEYLKEKEGIVANSPKSCFKEIFSTGFISEEEAVGLQEMTDSRNDTAHTYKEEVAQAIYEKIGGYIALMENTLKKVRGSLATS